MKDRESLRAKQDPPLAHRLIRTCQQSTWVSGLPPDHQQEGVLDEWPLTPNVWSYNENGGGTTAIAIPPLFVLLNTDVV